MIIASVQHIHNNSGKLVLQALVPFVDLIKYAVFTQRSDEYFDSEDGVEKSNEYYQRRMNSRRLKEIQQYIFRSILAERNNAAIATLFPTSMIVAIDREDEQITIDNGLCKLELPERVFIVDGQHRLMSMKMLYDYLNSIDIIKDEDSDYVIKYLSDYKFSCTILVNYDLWEQGQVFANVNFKQKPVNRSLYYEIYGTEYRDSVQDWSRNSIYLAHSLVSFMNKHEKSPYCGHIKMLGTGKGYVSQAFFVEAIIRHFRPTGLWWFNAESPDFSRHSYEYMAVELLSYYQVVKELFAKYWPGEKNEKGSLICKTTGTGAFLRLLGDMREKEDVEMQNALEMTSLGDICEKYCDQVRKRLMPVRMIAEKLFGEDSKYGGTGGKGLESGLYNEMKQEIKLAKLISDNPIMKMTPAERLAAQERLRHTSILGKLYFSGVKNFNELFDEYLRTHVISDLGLNSNHNEYKKVGFVLFTSLEKADDVILLRGKCSISLLSNLDPGKDVRIPLKVPCTFSVRIERKTDEWKFVDGGMDITTQHMIY